ncbi:MAG: TlpA family protein disulfide reductase [Candidatus Coatesbacteria bacterium]|nr:TlpA family protein disulfide reductase [Candidatus Coatesbacteria bacterium]
MTSKLALFAALTILLIVPSLGLCQYPTPFNDGDIAPDFTVQNLDEEWVSLSDWSGKIVVMDMWATWCGPCVAAVGILENDIWQVYKDRGLVVWGVDISPNRDTLAKIKDFAEQQGLTYPLALDVNYETQPYSSGYVPTMYIIDRKGVVRYGEVGFNKTAVISKIEELLEEDPVGPSFDLKINKMDVTPYVPGDFMNISADVTNPGDALPVNIFIAVEIFDEFFFWPSYSSMMTPTPYTLPDSLVLLNYMLESIAIQEGWPPIGDYTWYGVLASPLDGEWITEPSIVQCSVGVATP